MAIFMKILGSKYFHSLIKTKYQIKLEEIISSASARYSLPTRRTRPIHGAVLMQVHGWSKAASGPDTSSQ